MDVHLYGFRIFCQVVKSGTFSEAARVLRVTQPTVSQQISKLESVVETKLFERVGHDIHLTHVGREFYQFASDVLERTDGFSESLRNQRSLPSGLVRYAMPESCQWTPHYRRIMSQIREFPDIRFEIGILPNDLIVKGLLEGELDFGFTVGDRLNPELRFEKFGDERYSAVASDSDFFEPFQSADFTQLRLISFPGWESFFMTWAKASGHWSRLKGKMGHPTVRIGTLAGAIHAVQEGAGVAIIPTHCVHQELEERRLREYRPGKTFEASNPVHVARRTGEKFPRRVQLVLDLLKKAKQEIG